MFTLFDYFLSLFRNREAAHESRLNDTNLAVVGAILLFFVVMAYATSNDPDSVSSTYDLKTLQELKDLYRRRRDEFRSNPRAMEELLEWKRKNDHYNFKILYASCILSHYAVHLLLE